MEDREVVSEIRLPHIHKGNKGELLFSSVEQVRVEVKVTNLKFGP